MTRVDHSRMANAIRALAMDAVEKAKSGHPGLPMGAADVATVLFTQFLKFDAADPHWPDRDRFILSAGHGSMLLYALLYLTGNQDMTLDQLKNFRQLDSKTPGHPENFITAGIETTTGPLGQGVATSVGMALAERLLAAEFGEDIVDHYTYVLCSDGDLMEGVSHEAIALAGHLKLNKLIFLYDDNGITIDGPISLTDDVDQVARFKAARLERRVQIDGHDQKAIAGAITPGAEIRPAVADRLQDHHRFRRADTRPAPPRRMASRSAPKNSPAPRRLWAGITARSKFRTTCCRPGATSASRAQARMQRMAQRGSTAKPEAQARRIQAPRDRPQAAARPRRSRSASSRKSWSPSRRRSPPARRANWRSRCWCRRCRNCCSARPTSRLPTTPAPRA